MENAYARLLVDLAESGLEFVTVGGLACAMNGQTVDSLMDHIRHKKIGTTLIPYLDIPGMLLLKSNSLREKDRIDVLALERLLRERQDG